MRILIVYGTTEGQTRKIARFIEAEIEKAGHSATICDSTEKPENPCNYDAVIIGASMHMEKYQSSIANFIQKHKQVLNKMHTAFYSVSLTAAGDDEESWKELKHITQSFLQHTGWKPAMVEYVAGALLFSEYDFLKKYILRLIAKRAGHPNDGKHDTEFTNWTGLETFTKQFINSWVPPAQNVCEIESDAQAIG